MDLAWRIYCNRIIALVFAACRCSADCRCLLLMMQFATTYHCKVPVISWWFVGQKCGSTSSSLFWVMYGGHGGWPHRENVLRRN